MADEPQDKAPEGLETKDAQLEFRPSPVPNENRTGSALTDEEREAAGRPWQGSEGGPAISGGGGVGHDSGGTSSQQSFGQTEQAAPAAKSGRASKA